VIILFSTTLPKVHEVVVVLPETTPPAVSQLLHETADPGSAVAATMADVPLDRSELVFLEVSGY
jgi:hypothetical protein